MSVTTFLLGIHNHQPIGNFPEVFESAYQKAYLPFLEVIKKYPSIKWSLHLSGILWDFMKDKHPEYIKMLKKMVEDGRLEILSGGYYEPILAAIPDRDKIGQIKKLNTFIKNTFGQKPKGLWLTERIWEPTLPKILNELAIEYTLTDDYHFLSAGQNPDELRGYYVTEEEGYKLSIFPISQKLRYYIPFEDVSRSIELFKNSTRYNSSLTMGDDGEKFGLWPKTYEHVYRDGWLDRFFGALVHNEAWLKTDTFSGFMKTHPPSGRIYLPTTSYFEMSGWTLPAVSHQELEEVLQKLDRIPDGHSIKKFVRGGFWRNFLTKYPEANNMHKKMLYVSDKIDEARRKMKTKGRKVFSSFQTALDHLYASQCNCAYWHGVFGGLYLPHLRKAVYEELIKAQRYVLEAGGGRVKIASLDINKDGRDEIIYDSPSQSLYILPAYGGSIYEWDLYDPPVNVLNVLTRRYEAYHKRLKEFVTSGHQQEGVATIHHIVKVKEKNLERYLNYDWHGRLTLLDHFLGPQVSFEQFYKCAYIDSGNFTIEPYEVKIAGDVVELSRTGMVSSDGILHKTHVCKKIKPYDNNLLKVEYTLKNLSDSRCNYWFAVESNFAFFSKFDVLNQQESRNFKFTDEGTGLLFNLNITPSGILWAFPIETVSLSEDGFERTLQGGCIATSWKFELNSGESKTFTIEMAWQK